MCSCPRGSPGNKTPCVLPHCCNAPPLCPLNVSTVFAELQDAVAEVMPTLQEQGIAVYLLSDACPIQGVHALAGQISQASDEPLCRDLRANVHVRSTALYIYTSGTTGTEQTKGLFSQFKVVQSKLCCNSTSNHQGGSRLKAYPLLCFPVFNGRFAQSCICDPRESLGCFLHPGGVWSHLRGHLLHQPASLSQRWLPHRDGWSHREG